MESRLIRQLYRLKGWRLWTILALITVFAALLVVAAMSLLLNGEVTADYLLTGLVAAGCVAPPSLALLNHLLGELARQRQQALSNDLGSSQTLLKVALDSSDEGILVVARDGKILALNKRFREIWQISQELADTGLDELLLAKVLEQLADPEMFLAEVRRLYGTSEETRDTLHLNDGRFLARYSRALSVAGQDGRIWCFMDITESKRAEQRSRDSEANFHAFFDTIDDLLFVLDGAGMIQRVNRTVVERLGYAEDELVGRPVLDVHPADRRAEAAHIVAEMLAGREEFCPVPLITSSGQLIPVETRAVLGTWNGMPAVFGVSRDITERIRIQDALENEISRRRILVDQSHDGIAVLRTDGSIVEFNPAFSEMLGYPPVELEQMKVWDWDIHIDKDKLKQLVGEFGQQHLKLETRHRRKNDTQYDVEVSITGVEWAGETLLYCLHQDITARKLAEEALRESEFFLRESQRIGQLGGWRADPVRNTVMWTEGVYAITEMPLDFKPDLETALDAYPPGSREKVVENLHRTLQTGEPFSIQVEVTGARSGLNKWCELRGFPHFDADGRVDYATGTLQDISEYKQSEQKLRDSEMRYRNLAENSADWIWVMNAEGKHIYSSNRIITILGFTQDEFYGMAPQDIVHPDDREHFMATFQNACATQSGWSRVLIRWQGKDGSYRTLESSASPAFNADGQLVGFQGVDRDVTERMAIEAELDQHREHLEELINARTLELATAKEAAEAASRAKSTFLANMSHELRTPMNAIMGMNAMALRRATDPKLRDQLDKIDQASQHLLAVINDILDISKIEAERLTLEHVSFRLGEVLEKLMHLITHKVEEKRLKLHLDLPPDLVGLTLLGDSLRLGQILLNLSGNALKFTAQGSITLRARLIENNHDAVLLRWEVADTGIGISAEDQKRLFTAFEQADGSMTRKYGGTGLGLAISKRLVHMMQGEIGVDSQPGAGSTFWFTARLDKAPTVNDAVAPAPTISQLSAEEQLLGEYAGTRILLAEDEPINQEISRGLLEDVGMQVDVANDGAEAVDLAKRSVYALILMDMQMPILNGMDATRQIRGLSGYDKTPILAMTANAFDEDRQLCLDAGMDDHIAKPVYPDVLYETVLKWLAKSGGYGA